MSQKMRLTDLAGAFAAFACVYLMVAGVVALAAQTVERGLMFELALMVFGAVTLVVSIGWLGYLVVSGRQAVAAGLPLDCGTFARRFDSNRLTSVLASFFSISSILPPLVIPPTSHVPPAIRLAAALVLLSNLVVLMVTVLAQSYLRRRLIPSPQKIPAKPRSLWEPF